MQKHSAIKVSNLKKTYGQTQKLALDGINIDIPYGSIFGLLGPNGAGKSTFINILGGLTNKTSGTVEICGINIDVDPKTARGTIGVVPQEIIIDPFFSPIEIMNIQAGLYGIKKKEMKNFEILDKLNLADKVNAYARSLSGGMKRRLMVAKALVHSPPILVLDEPTAGVDIELRRNLWKYIKKLNRDGITIILTTHYLEEAEKMCDKIAIINKGKIVASETKNDLLNIINDKEIFITLSKPISKIPKIIKKYVKYCSNKQLVIKYNKTKITTGELLEKLNICKIGIIELKTRDSDLEEIFLKILKKK